VSRAGKAYFEVGKALGFNWLKENAATFAAPSYWDKLAMQALVAEISDEQRKLSDAALNYKGSVADWLLAEGETMARVQHFIGEIEASGSADLGKFPVALKHIRSL